MKRKVKIKHTYQEEKELFYGVKFEDVFIEADF